ncbi:unnamed protein product [Euphydryas editha]|uniref:Uncharacterized protein n=1 Tax=Euphydryas editha TaxID=104508 RepID=A0AAU9U8W6_EUPED|nr:unnamed protein product [Euphydryas editha]
MGRVGIVDCDNSLWVIVLRGSAGRSFVARAYVVRRPAAADRALLPRRARPRSPEMFAHERRRNHVFIEHSSNSGNISHHFASWRRLVI